MDIYLVGGAVRDKLLGMPVTERDWVVVGADEAAMRERGFIPADRDFPVFLHPDTGEEYALARREVKRGEGYRGFDVHAGADVALEEDLRRRDLTINAMAQGEGGRIIDPFDGRADLAAGRLRHVSPAFVEDPLRVLRVARFAAKLGRRGFCVAHTTHRLMRQMVQQGEMRHIGAERLWREMRSAMQTEQPWRFFEVLHSCGALVSLIAPLATAMGDWVAHGSAADSAPIAALKRIAGASRDAAPTLVTALLGCVASVEDAGRLAAALRADRETARLLKRAVAGRPLCERAVQGDAEALFELALLWRGFDAAAEAAMLAAICDAQTGGGKIGQYLAVALPAARRVSPADLKAQGLQGAVLGRRLAEQRQAEMQSALRAAGLVP